MKYAIKGDNFPVVICRLDAGEEVICQAGAMTWMDSSIKMKTETGGLGKMIGKALTKESIFQNRYVAEASGEIALGSTYPGQIMAIPMDGSKTIIAQKGSFLAHSSGISMDMYLQKKVAGGLFGGEGFIMQRFTGTGILFLEIDGSSETYTLAAGQQKIIDTGYLVTMDETCSLDVQMIKGVGNVLFGGEGLFNTVITGPGNITLQTMSSQNMIASIVAAVSSRK